VTENHYRLSGALAPRRKTRRLLYNIKSEALNNRGESCKLVRSLMLNFVRNADKTGVSNFVRNTDTTGVSNFEKEVIL
jgi:hypothetical protein